MFSYSSNMSLITLPGEGALVHGCRAVLGEREGLVRDKAPPLDEPFAGHLAEPEPLNRYWLVGGRGKHNLIVVTLRC